MSLLTLAMLLAYAAPGHATLVPHPNAGTASEHALPDEGVASMPGDGHGQGPCEDLGVTDDGACCDMVRCATMHGGLLADAVPAPAPGIEGGVRLPSPATPEGIDGDPALRPPRPTI